MTVTTSSIVDDDRREFVEHAFRTHGGAVFALARGLCGPVLAAEITQDVFLRLWTTPDRFDPCRGTLRTFLLTACRGRALDVLTSEAALRRREVTAQHRSRSGPDRDVEDAVVREHDRSRILAALGELPMDEREAIAMTFFGGCTYRRAAELLGEPEGTVKSRIRRGLKQLRSTLASQVIAEDETALGVPTSTDEQARRS